MDYEIYDEINFKAHLHTFEGIKGVINITCINERKCPSPPPEEDGTDSIQESLDVWAAWADSLPPSSDICGITRCPSGKFEVYQEKSDTYLEPDEDDEDNEDEDDSSVCFDLDDLETTGEYWEKVIGLVPETKKTTSFYEGTVWLKDGWIIVWLP